jgi:hypothetical protein
MGVPAFGAMGYTTFSRIIAAAGASHRAIEKMPTGMRHAAEGIQSLRPGQLEEVGNASEGFFGGF